MGTYGPFLIFICSEYKIAYWYFNNTTNSSPQFSHSILVEQRLSNSFPNEVLINQQNSADRPCYKYPEQTVCRKSSLL